MVEVVISPTLVVVVAFVAIMEPPDAVDVKEDVVEEAV